MLINIQFLRFVAAMLVVAYHLAGMVEPARVSQSAVLQLAQASGFAGVDIFFVISGFIMAHTTLGIAGPRHGGAFARRRLARIYSGYWPFFVLTLLVFAWTRPEHVAAADLMRSLWLWPQPLNLILLEITWTLSFELYFYAMFALLVCCIPDAYRFRVCLAAMGLLLVIALYRHGVLHRYDPEHFYLVPFWLSFTISPYLVEFFAGAVLAGWVQRRPNGPGWAWLIAGTLLFGLAALVNNRWFGGHLEQGFHTVPRVMLFGTASFCIVLGLVRLEHSGRRAPRAFSLVSGGASYAIYLSHILILSLAAHVGLIGWLGQLPLIVAMVGYGLMMSATWGYSVAHYRLVERPLHRLFRRLVRV